MVTSSKRPAWVTDADMEPISMDDIDGHEELPADLEHRVFMDLGCSKVNFSPVYSYILGRASSTTEFPRILEIGIGTNKKGAISAMGENYVPGASLRSYKALVENAQIFGVDYDTSCLFSEERIETAFGD